MIESHSMTVISFFFYFVSRSSCTFCSYGSIVIIFLRPPSSSMTAFNGKSRVQCVTQLSACILPLHSFSSPTRYMCVCVCVEVFVIVNSHFYLCGNKIEWRSCDRRRRNYTRIKCTHTNRFPLTRNNCILIATEYKIDKKWPTYRRRREKNTRQCVTFFY